MERTISEPDWKVFRQLQPIALDRFCQRVLAEVGRLAADTGKGSHERYLAVFKLMERRDEELAHAFNDMRRSTAFQQLASICFHSLLADEEFARFSPETRQAVEVFLELWRG
ncbi:MAG: hypothetical protein JWO38_7317 [Gemmataceae bacterium]|nr:hypothetical protein [Gemmataceae bacterium]